MNIDEFTKIVVLAGVLSVDEENAIFRALLGATGVGGIRSSESGDQLEAGSSGSPRVTSGVHGSHLPFPCNSRNFVATRCDIAYDGYTRHGTGSASSLYRLGAVGATPHKTGWSLTLYCDHSIKVCFSQYNINNIYLACRSCVIILATAFESGDCGFTPISDQA